jgi:hypothetical protein
MLYNKEGRANRSGWGRYAVINSVLAYFVDALGKKSPRRLIVFIVYESQAIEG